MSQQSIQVVEVVDFRMKSERSAQGMVEVSESCLPQKPEQSLEVLEEEARSNKRLG